MLHAPHDSRRPLRIGYLIPEFPGQTHIWMWREMLWTERWAEHMHIFSTQNPSDRDRARHAFAEESREKTTFLWPLPSTEAVRWAATERRAGLLRAIKLCFTLPIDRRPAFAHLAKLLPSACFLAKCATDQRLTHLHSHSCANCAVLAMMAKRIIGIPFSLTLNANVDWWGGAMSEKFQDADFTLAITEWLLAQLRKDYPELAPDQALLGRIGVDTDAWPPKEYIAERRSPFHVVTVGRLHFSKGHDILISAVQKLIEEQCDVTLCLVGDGPQRAELEAQVNAAGLNERIRFVGSLAEDGVKEQLRRADAFALASHAEPLGVVYMEAMAAGVPTIGTAAGGVGEIITNGTDGLLVEPKNVDALARAIRQLIDDPELARSLAINGRRTIVERFDSRIGAATLYTRLMGVPPPDTALGTG